jgi:DNA repair exonuclease SbcCD ATPase subunit
VIDDGEGVTISRQKVASRTRDAEKTFAKQVNNESDLAAIKNSRAEFLRKHEIRAPFTKIAPSLEGPGYTPVGKGVKKYAQPIPAAEAQAEKIGTYLQLRGKYGQLGSAEVEAQKALARGLKEELAEAFPKLKELNARDSRLLQLQTALERATKRINNREQLPIGSVTLSTIKSIVDSPTIKSHLAIALARAGDKNAPRTVSRGMAALNALLQETVVSTTPQ